MATRCSNIRDHDNRLAGPDIRTPDAPYRDVAASIKVVDIATNTLRDFVDMETLSLEGLKTAYC